MYVLPTQTNNIVPVRYLQKILKCGDWWERLWKICLFFTKWTPQIHTYTVYVAKQTSFGSRHNGHYAFIHKIALPFCIAGWSCYLIQFTWPTHRMNTQFFENIKKKNGVTQKLKGTNSPQKPSISSNTWYVDTPMTTRNCFSHNGRHSGNMCVYKPHKTRMLFRILNRR